MSEATFLQCLPPCSSQWSPVIRTVGDLPSNNCSGKGGGGAPTLIAEEKAIFATDPPWEPPHQSSSGGEDGGGVGAKPELARFLLQAGEEEENINVCPRIQLDLKGQQLLVITGYFWQFDVSSRPLRQGRWSWGREWTWSGRLCGMHFKRLYIQVVCGSEPQFDLTLFFSLFINFFVF